MRDKTPHAPLTRIDPAKLLILVVNMACMGYRKHASQSQTIQALIELRPANQGVAAHTSLGDNLLV